MSTPTRYSLPAKRVKPQMAANERAIDRPTCHNGTLESATRVNITIGLTSGIIDAITANDLSGSLIAKIETRYAMMIGIMITPLYCCTSSALLHSAPTPANSAAYEKNPKRKNTTR